MIFYFLLVCVMDTWSKWSECKCDEETDAWTAMDERTCYKVRTRDVLTHEGSFGSDHSCDYEEEEDDCDCGALS